MNTIDEAAVDIDLLARIYREYLALPGMQLTLAQASRLWNLNLETSAHVLEHLVHASLLCRNGDHYVLAGADCTCA